MNFRIQWISHSDLHITRIALETLAVCWELMLLFRRPGWKILLLNIHLISERLPSLTFLASCFYLLMVCLHHQSFVDMSSWDMSINLPNVHINLPVHASPCLFFLLFLINLINRFVIQLENWNNTLWLRGQSDIMLKLQRGWLRGLMDRKAWILTWEENMFVISLSIHFLCF